MSVLKVTLDTNVLGQTIRHELQQTIRGLPIELGHISVTAREQEHAYFSPPGFPVLETIVWGESIWGQSVWGKEQESSSFEGLLRLISHGSFPRPGNREVLTPGQRNQFRDAMILFAHIRSGRDIFVTNEKRAFIGKNGTLQEKLETYGSTRIMSVEAFCKHCDALRMQITVPEEQELL